MLSAELYWTRALLIIWLFAIANFQARETNTIYSSDSTFSIDPSKLVLNLIRNQTSDRELARTDKSGYYIFFNNDVQFHQENILADKLYNILGVPTPHFLVMTDVHNLPEELFHMTKQAPFVQIVVAPLSEMCDHTDLQVFSEWLRNRFVVDAFLGNMEPFNTEHCIQYDGKLLRTTYTGNVFHYKRVDRLKGAKKSDEWDPRLIPELTALPKLRPDIYGDITMSMIETQARAIISKGKDLFHALCAVATATNMTFEVKDMLEAMLLSRLQVLEMLVTPGITYPAEISRPPSHISAAGAFLTCTENGTTYALLGSRKSKHAEIDGRWVSLGGKSEVKIEHILIQTAQREIYEETTGFISGLGPFIQTQFHDLIEPNHLYRMYFTRLDACFNADGLLHNSVPIPDSLRHNRHIGKYEYHAFRWFPVSLMSRVARDGGLPNSPGGERLYLPFAVLLQNEHIQGMLRSIVRNETVYENLYTQSMPYHHPSNVLNTRYNFYHHNTTSGDSSSSSSDRNAENNRIPEEEKISGDSKKIPTIYAEFTAWSTSCS